MIPVTINLDLPGRYLSHNAVLPAVPRQGKCIYLRNAEWAKYLIEVHGCVWCRVKDVSYHEYADGTWRVHIECEATSNLLR